MLHFYIVDPVTINGAMWDGEIVINTKLLTPFPHLCDYCKTVFFKKRRSGLLSCLQTGYSLKKACTVLRDVLLNILEFSVYKLAGGPI